MVRKCDVEFFVLVLVLVIELRSLAVSHVLLQIHTMKPIANTITSTSMSTKTTNESVIS